MLTRLDNDADVFATLQAVDRDPAEPCSTPRLIALISQLCPEDEDLEVIINKDLLRDSYKCNPSMLSRNALGASHSFQSHSATTLSTTHIYVKLMRGEKPPLYHVKPADAQTLMQRTLAWLDSDKEEPLEVPNEYIPLSIMARPEQFVYNVRRTTGEQITFRKLKNFIRITLKNKA